MADAVTRYGGHVAKYRADGVLAYFGWPQAYEDQAERAERTGLDAVAVVSRLKFYGVAEALSVAPLRARCMNELR
ncbi:MAG: hypothetical protein H8E30_09650 [Alphaproteobacteria bacterium]|nr:hypothetical protein [Alphaproteobacteria bacterium]